MESTCLTGFSTSSTNKETIHLNIPAVHFSLYLSQGSTDPLTFRTLARVSAAFQLERRWWTRTLERSTTPTYSCWLRNSLEDSRECAEDLTATYVEWCAWWQRRRWRWWGRRATRWTCRRNGSSSFPHSCPPRDSGGRNALSGQKHGKKTS